MLQDKLRGLSDKLPEDRGDRIKLLSVAIVLPILLIWLTYYLIASMWPPPKAVELNTSGWQTARELTEQLNKDTAFLDVGLVVESESPLKFGVKGAVHADRDLVKLTAKLKELRPEGDYEMHVEVLKPQPQ